MTQASNPHLRGIEAAEELEGTCLSIHEVASEEETDDPDFCEALDDLVFLCSTCSWWCEVAERADDGEDGEPKCTDCHEE